MSSSMLQKCEPLAVCLALLCVLCLSGVSARSAVKGRRSPAVPQLSDALSVARSPFEPITLAPNLPGARNNEAPNSAAAAGIQQPNESTSTTEERKQTTRSAPEQNGSPDDSTGLNNSGQTTSQLGEPTSDGARTEAPSEPSSTQGESTERTIAASTATDLSSEPAASSTETTKELVTSSVELDTAVSTTSEPVASTSSDEPAPVTSAPPSVVETSATEKETTEAETTTKALTTTPTTTTPTPTPTPTTTTTTPAPTTTTATTTTTAASTTSTTTTPASETTTAVPESTTTTTDIVTTTQAPTTAVATGSTTTETVPSTTPVAASTTAQPALIGTTSAGPLDEKDDEEKKKTGAACNHLPTYDSDEVQKVFREEITYKNGTIKGKFTYINFDQRYRLVHYTRQPYGAVKIDLVEELGKPNKVTNTQPGSSAIGEIPNAVLQLRNLLPSSMFGFPFLNPSSANGQLGSVMGPREGNDEDKYNMYFYSTDSLATPNLLTPRVPVSLLPGQRLQQTTGSSPADNLAPGFFEHANLKPKQAHRLDEQSQNVLKQQQQRQYSQPEQPRALFYDYFAPQQSYPPSVQYNSLPIYQSPAGFGYDQPKIITQHQHQFQHHQIVHQAHQPHSHEHFIAPFMFSKPASAGGEINENPRLRLRVKTSKALNSDTGTKSAQLRLQPDSLYAPPANSPIQLQQQRAQPRQRLGKQNHDLRTNSQNLPVVYHVLRSPAGRTFNMPQSNQGYAIAYDHDD